MTPETFLQSLGDDNVKLNSIFHPYMFDRALSVINNNKRFAHYTSASTAMNIFKHEEVWMRNTACMNDFMEIEYGFKRLNAQYKKHKDRAATAIDALYPKLMQKVEETFNSWLPHFRIDTYIACFSEHCDENTGDEEDKIGRLSMWRAYGGPNGVAVIVRKEPFLRPSNALMAFTSPVAYLDEASFELEFTKLLTNIESNRDYLAGRTEEQLVGYIFLSFRYAILCTKHPGFREEREWRVIYSPTYQNSKVLIKDIQSINGIPQTIYKIPLKDVPEEGLFGIQLNELVERVIIGPAKFPYIVKEALIEILNSKGVKSAADRIFVSDIPLRQIE